MRTAVLADSALQAEFAALTEEAPFAARLVAESERRGIALGYAEAAAMLQPDPLGLARFTPRAPDGRRWPGPAWMPVSAGTSGGEAHVDWLHFGARRPLEPFFQDTIRAVQSLPFNRAFRYRMRLADFLQAAEAGPAPDGLIFHMSRCGSTLAAQMLAALPESLVLSEPPALDDILQLALPAGEDAAVAALRAAGAAFGCRGRRPYVLKLDCWHALALPLFRRAFPQTPWVFLYRDAVEVLVSHMRMRGAQMVPELISPALFGLETDIPDEDYCAAVLAAVCRAAAQHLALGGGLSINYRQLPTAVGDVILPHFGIAVDARGREAMARAALRDAKAPREAFSADGDEKRRGASAAVVAAAARHLAGVYADLESCRQTNAAQACA